VLDKEQSGCLYLVTGDLKQKVNAEFGKTGSLQFLNYMTPPPFFDPPKSEERRGDMKHAGLMERLGGDLFH